jgi:hypothetical protein
MIVRIGVVVGLVWLLSACAAGQSSHKCYVNRAENNDGGPILICPF